MRSNARAAKNFDQRLREFLAYRGNQDDIEIAVAVELYLTNPNLGHEAAFKDALEILKYQKEVMPIIEPSDSDPRRATITFAVPGGGQIQMRLHDGVEGCALRSTKGRLPERKACGREIKRISSGSEFLKLIAARRRSMSR